MYTASTRTMSSASPSKWSRALMELAPGVQFHEVIRSTSFGEYNPKAVRRLVFYIQTLFVCSIEKTERDSSDIK